MKSSLDQTLAFQRRLPRFRSAWRKPQRAAGFTLLEVLVAVAILATALAAVVSGGATYADSASYLHEKTLALWVAHNRMSEIELAPPWPDPGTGSDDVQMGGINWTWHTKVSSTPDPGLRRIDVSVEKTDDKRKPKRAYAELTGFISRVGRQQ
jgi:general secretion pathway protein I